MTQEREIKLPPLPVYMDSVTPEQFAERVRAWGRTAVEADRQNQFRDATKMVQSSGKPGELNEPSGNSGELPGVNQSTEREAFEVWARKELGDPIRLTMRERNLGAQAWAAATRAALAQQPSGQDREDAADMFWDADDPERFGGDNLHDTLVDLADDYGDPDFPVTVRLQCAKRLPDVQVVVTGRNDDGELVYEVIDAARAAKERT